MIEQRHAYLHKIGNTDVTIIYTDETRVNGHHLYDDSQLIA